MGAFTTGEVNLTASDRPLRVRAALVDEHLLTALGLQAAQGRLFAHGETDVSGQWAPGNEPPPAPVAILSHELWQTAFGGGSIVGQTIDVDGRRRNWGRHFHSIALTFHLSASAASFELQNPEHEA